jgi:uncharacterized protein involved in exopolysaccharide biosynthesis
MIPNIFLILWRRWKLFLAVFIPILGLVAAATSMSQKKYRSEAKLYIRLGRENVVLDPTSTFGQGPVVAIPASREMELGSIAEMASSRFLLEQVVYRIGPEKILGTDVPPSSPFSPIASASSATPFLTAADSESSFQDIDPAVLRSEPFDKAVRLLAEQLNVEIIKKTSTISISCEGSSPETSQAVVTALVDLAVERHLHLHRSPKGLAFLSQQTERLRSELDVFEETLKRKKIDAGLFFPEGQRQAAVALVTRLQEEIATTRGARAAAEKECAALAERLAKLSPTQVTARTSGVPNEAAGGMRNQLYTLEIREQELLARHPPGHPELQLVQKQAQAVREILREEERTLEQTTVGPNRLYEEGQVALLRQEAALAALQAKLDSLEQELNQERTALRTLTENEVELTRLLREVDLLKTSYLKYAQNVEQTQIDRALEEEKISNISVMQPATYDAKPVKPRWSLNLAVGFMLALTAGFSLAWLAESSPNATRKE